VRCCSFRRSSRRQVRQNTDVCESPTHVRRAAYSGRREGERSAKSAENEVFCEPRAETRSELALPPTQLGREAARCSFCGNGMTARSNAVSQEDT